MASIPALEAYDEEKFLVLSKLFIAMHVPKLDLSWKTYTPSSPWGSSVQTAESKKKVDGKREGKDSDQQMV